MSDARGICRTAVITGVQASEVVVEAASSQGIPGIVITGMPDAMIKESVARIRSAIRASRFSVPRSRITINLAPARMRKTGTGVDLAIALAILEISGQIPPSEFQDMILIGELSLDGSVRPVPGILAFLSLAETHGRRLLCQPDPGVTRVRTSMLTVLDHLSQLRDGAACGSPPRFNRNSVDKASKVDFSDVKGQKSAKRGLMIAAAGNHSLLMVGSPGAGKTMLAKRLSTILPELREEQRRETAGIYSVSGLPYGRILEGGRPFLAPHHSATKAGLLGGGSPLRPGVVSLAHNGILFLDEMAEFSPSVLQSLRQPIESGSTVLVRAEGSYKMPSDFQLIAASNPCPCGFLTESDGRCTCSSSKIRAYQGRIGGPLIDRFSLLIFVKRPKVASVLSERSSMGSKQMQQRVEAARVFRKERTGKMSSERSVRSVDDIGSVVNACVFDNATRRRFEMLAESRRMTGRGVVAIAQLSRTIADIEESTSVKDEHVEEAFAFRKEGFGV